MGRRFTHELTTDLAAFDFSEISLVNLLPQAAVRNETEKRRRDVVRWWVFIGCKLKVDVVLGHWTSATR